MCLRLLSFLECILCWELGIGKLFGELENEVLTLTINRGDEIGRRAGIFYVGQMLGILTAGLITSGTSAHLDGVAGLAGWR